MDHEQNGLDGAPESVMAEAKQLGGELARLVDEAPDFDGQAKTCNVEAKRLGAEARRLDDE